MSNIDTAIERLERLKEAFDCVADNATAAVSDYGCVAYMGDDPFQWEREIDGVVALLRGPQQRTER